MATDLGVHFWSGANGGGGGGSGGFTMDVEDEGVFVVTDPTFMNFIGAGVDATVNGAGVDITIPGGGGTPFQEVPTGSINNVNLIFTLSQAPNPAAGLELYQDGLVLVQGVDYSISGATITMAVAPNFGQTLYAFYVIVTGASAPGAPYQQVPVGLINGSNTAFTVSPSPTPTAAFELYLDGLIQVQTVDYTIIGGTITMAIAPAVGQTLYAVFTVIGGAVSGVSDLNGASGSLTIVAGTGISVGTVGTVITVSNTATSMSRTVVGTVGAPTLITAVGGIGFTGTQDFSKHYIAGNGGAVTVTANPQIAAGVSDGQELTLESTSATNTVTLNNGTGLIMNGPWIGGLGSIITFSWNTVSWVEKGRQ